MIRKILFYEIWRRDTYIVKHWASVILWICIFKIYVSSFLILHPKEIWKSTLFDLSIPSLINYRTYLSSSWRNCCYSSVMLNIEISVKVLIQKLTWKRNSCFAKDYLLVTVPIWCTLLPRCYFSRKKE